MDSRTACFKKHDFETENAVLEAHQSHGVVSVVKQIFIRDKRLPRFMYVELNRNSY